MKRPSPCPPISRWPLCALVPVLLAAPPASGQSATRLPASIVEAEEARIETIRRITPATIAVFDQQATNGGSGVIVSPDGLAVTNFHVVAPCGAFMKCGLPDGRLVDAVLVGVDPPGDVAVIRLLEEGGGGDGPTVWPAAVWGDSDLARVGDEVFVAGNPFLLADDFQPTITHGILSGVHRYQYPAGSLLEYADCLQTDAAINPGNSGGPLYDAAGRLIGINGRGSFEKRGRVNVGVGYAISANQVKRFLSHLAGGRIMDHASLGLTVRSGGGRRAVVNQIRESSDAYRRGLRYGDQILRFGGREIRSANALQNALGTYPPGWRVPIEYQRGYETLTAVVRLERLHGVAELEELVAGQLRPRGPAPPFVADRYSARTGFANHYFNEKNRDRVLAACRQLDAAPEPAFEWTISGEEAGRGGVTIRLGTTRCGIESERGRYWVSVEGPLGDQLAPPGSGGLLAGLHLWRGLLAGDAAGVEYRGRLPWGPRLEIHECLTLSRGAATAEFFFHTETSDLVGVDFYPAPAVDACRIEFGDFQLGEVSVLPGRMRVHRGDTLWLELTIDDYASKKRAPEGDD